MNIHLPKPVAYGTILAMFLMTLWGGAALAAPPSSSAATTSPTPFTVVPPPPGNCASSTSVSLSVGQYTYTGPNSLGGQSPWGWPCFVQKYTVNIWSNYSKIQFDDDYLSSGNPNGGYADWGPIKTIILYSNGTTHTASDPNMVCVPIQTNIAEATQYYSAAWNAQSFSTSDSAYATQYVYATGTGGCSSQFTIKPTFYFYP